MRLFLLSMVVFAMSATAVHAQDPSVTKSMNVQADSLALIRQLEGSYVASLPSNPGNFTTAKLLFKQGVPQMFVDEMQVSVLECRFTKESALLQIDVVGERVSLQVIPTATGIKGIATYEDMKIPFAAKKENP